MAIYEVEITYRLLTEVEADSSDYAIAKADDWRNYIQTPAEGKNLVVVDAYASAENDQ